jgi:integrase
VPDLTIGQFWKIVNSAPAHVRPAYVVLAASGMRLGEYLRCDQTHLNAASHSINVPGTKTAASADTVYVEPELWPWVEAGIPSPLARRWLWLYWRRACAIARRPDLRLHDLRHFYAQIADLGGATTESVMAALRHTNPATTRGYKMRKVKGEVARLVGRALATAGAD